MISSKANNNYPLAFIHENATIGNNVTIEPFTTIEEGVEIGTGSVIGPNVTIKKGVKIGERCKINAGVFISADTGELAYWEQDRPKQVGLAPRLIIGNDVHIEPSATIHGVIKIGDGCWIGSNATIHDGARIGNKCKIFPGAVISAIPQDLKFQGEHTTLEIGDNTVVRECATLNRGTTYRGKTAIGKNVLIMAYVHIAHDCIIGDKTIISNSVNLAGHVEIGEQVVIGGVSAFRQFVKVGNHAFISGGSLVRKDVPPYVKAGREPLQYVGVNSIGLRRRNFSSESIHAIQDIYREIFLSEKNTSQALEHIEAHHPATLERDEIITFIRRAERGIIKGLKPNEVELLESEM